MAGDAAWRDPMERLITEHRDVSEYLDTLKEVRGFLYGTSAWKDSESIESFFVRRVVSHFAFEEGEIFSRLLSGIALGKAGELIAELQDEHAGIQEIFEEFRAARSESAAGSGADADVKLYSIGRNLIDKLLTHAAREDDELMPVIRENLQLFDSAGDGGDK